MNKKKGKTENSMRTYRCKMCGADVSMPLYTWRHLPQAHKRLCNKCMPSTSPVRERPYRPYTADLYSPFNFKF